MAHEVTVTASLSVVKGEFQFHRKVANLRRDWSDHLAAARVMTVDNTAGGTLILLPFAPNGAGWAWFRNVGGEPIDIGKQTAGPTFIPVLTLESGETAMFRAPDPLYVKRSDAASADGLLEYLILQQS